jgi:hypothetical protein
MEPLIAKVALEMVIAPSPTDTTVILLEMVNVPPVLDGSPAKTVPPLTLIAEEEIVPTPPNVAPLFTV